MDENKTLKTKTFREKWALIGKNPDSGSRAEEIAKFNDLLPHELESLLTINEKIRTERNTQNKQLQEKNLLKLANSHSSLCPSAVSQYLLFIATESTFIENRNLARASYNLMTPHHVKTLFLALEMTDKSFARLLVRSAVLPPENVEVQMKCDSLDSTHLLRAYLLLQSAATAKYLDIKSHDILDSALALQPDFVVELFKTKQELIRKFISGPFLVRMLRHCGESEEAVATQAHTKAFAFALESTNFGTCFQYLMRNHLHDVIMPAIASAKNQIRQTIVPYLGYASYEQLISYLATFEFTVPLLNIGKVLERLRPINKRMTRVFGWLVAWLGARKSWSWTLANVRAHLGFVAPALLSTFLMQQPCMRDELHGLAAYLMGAMAQKPSFALTDADRLQLLEHVLSFKQLALSLVYPVYQALVAHASDAQVLFQATLQLYRYSAYVPVDYFFAGLTKLEACDRLQASSSPFSSNPYELVELVRAVECQDAAGRARKRVLLERSAMPRDEFWSHMLFLSGSSSQTLLAPVMPPPVQSDDREDKDDKPDDEGEKLLKRVAGKPEERRVQLEALVQSCEQGSVRRDYALNRLKQAARLMSDLVLVLPISIREAHVGVLTSAIKKRKLFVALASSANNELQNLWIAHRAFHQLTHALPRLVQSELPLGTDDAWITKYGPAADLALDVLGTTVARQHLMKLLHPSMTNLSNLKLRQMLLHNILGHSVNSIETSAEVMRLALDMTTASCPSLVIVTQDGHNRKKVTTILDEYPILLEHLAAKADSNAILFEVDKVCDDFCALDKVFLAYPRAVPGWTPFSADQVARALQAAVSQAATGEFSKAIAPLCARLQLSTVQKRDDLRGATVRALISCITGAKEVSYLSGALGLLAASLRSLTQYGQEADVVNVSRAIISRLEFMNPEDSVARTFLAQIKIPLEDFPRILERRDALVMLPLVALGVTCQIFHRGQLQLIPKILGFGENGRLFLDKLLQASCEFLQELLPETNMRLQSVSKHPRVLGTLAGDECLLPAIIETVVCAYPVKELTEFVDRLATRGNPISLLSILSRLPAHTDKEFKSKVRLGLQQALRSLPPRHRQEEILKALKVSNIGTTKVLLKISTDDTTFFARAISTVLEAGVLRKQKVVVHRDVRLFILKALIALPDLASRLPAFLYELVGAEREDEQYLVTQMLPALHGLWGSPPWIIRFLTQATLRGYLGPSTCFQILLNHANDHPAHRGELCDVILSLLAEAGSVKDSTCVKASIREEWRPVSLTSSTASKALMQLFMGQCADNPDWVDQAVLAISPLDMELALQMLCSSASLTRDIVSKLRKSFSHLPEDKWIPPLLSLLSNVTEVVKLNQSKVQIHKDIIMASRALVPPAKFFTYVTQFSATAGDETFFSNELKAMKPKNVILANLCAAKGLECAVVEWILAVLPMRSDKTAMEEALETVFARFLIVNPSEATTKLSRIPLRVQVRPDIVKAIATLDSSHVVAWLTRILEDDPTLCPTNLPQPILRAPTVSDLLLSSSSTQAQMQGLTMLVASKGLEVCASQIEAVLATTTSPLIAQHARSLLVKL